MKKADFEKLLESVRQAGQIRRGEIKPSREFIMKPVDVKKIRLRLRLTQLQFAAMIGVSVSTLRNWEQGRRRPVGPARALLMVAEKSPNVVRKALGK